MTIFENKTAQDPKVEAPISNKSNQNCGFCRKKNHTSEQCYRRAEVNAKGKGGEEAKLCCYRCGAAGFYKTNCPTCNGKEVAESPREMDFQAINITIVGRDVPTVMINVSGHDDTACLDTAARTSIAGRNLFE